VTGFLYDDSAGVRHSVTLKHYDTPLGSRRDLSNNFRFDSPTAPPPPPPPPPPTPTTTPQLLWYPSTRITDAGTIAAFGQRPQGWSSYWQKANYKSLVSVEGARMAQGGHVVNSYASVKDTATNPTGARDAVLGMNAGNPTSDLVDYITLSEQVASQYPDQFYCTHPMGEVEVFYNQTLAGKGTPPPLGSLFAYYSNDETAIMTALGQFHNNFFNLVDQIAPSLYRTFWMGGSQSTANNRIRNTFYSQITNPPSWITSDPYQNSYNPANKPINTWQSDYNLYVASTGAHHSHYLRWGSPQLAWNEIGINHNVYNDAEMAAWISQIMEGAVALNLHHICYFNSTGPNGAQFITGGSYPQSVSAFSGEITQAKQMAATA
jgi:hypothetical protein